MFLCSVSTLIVLGVCFRPAYSKALSCGSLASLRNHPLLAQDVYGYLQDIQRQLQPLRATLVLAAVIFGLSLPLQCIVFVAQTPSAKSPPPSRYFLHLAVLCLLGISWLFVLLTVVGGLLSVQMMQVVSQAPQSNQSLILIGGYSTLNILWAVLALTSVMILLSCMSLSQINAQADTKPAEKKDETTKPGPGKVQFKDLDKAKVDEVKPLPKPKKVGMLRSVCLALADSLLASRREN